MIIPITGKVTYSITLDPTVWIFDDRKILLDEAFTENDVLSAETDELEKAAQRWDRAVYQKSFKPPVNKSISRLEGEKILKNSYVMPISDFIKNLEIKSDANYAVLVTKDGDQRVSLFELETSYLQFAQDGKPLKDDGPVYFYFGDGSNKDAPVKNISKIIIQ